MYELVQVGKNTYYIDCPSKIGIYRMSDGRVCLIDSGSDKDAARKVMKVINENGWSVGLIINTHSHADHVGGNALSQQRTGAPAYCAGLDARIANDPMLEPTYLYGGYPCKLLRNKQLMAQPSEVRELTEEVLPEGLEMTRVDGHTFAMTAIKTDDDVWFLADSMTGELILEKYHISYIYDVEAYFASLEKLLELQGKLFILAHDEPHEDIRPLVQRNIDKLNEVLSTIRSTCAVPTNFEDVLKAVFDHFGLELNFTQYVLVGSTLRSCLSYLYDRGEVDCLFESNRLLWKTIE
jgi:glyoxylase-like metal-dependent hydrolase (beta-lactamase superfamily II)